MPNHDQYNLVLEVSQGMSNNGNNVFNNNSGGVPQ